MVRPHPAVWRLTHGIMVCYLLFLTYLLFQNVDDARQLMRVREPLPGRQRSGSKACRGGGGGRPRPPQAAQPCLSNFLLSCGPRVVAQ